MTNQEKLNKLNEVADIIEKEGGAGRNPDHSKDLDGRSFADRLSFDIEADDEDCEVIMDDGESASLHVDNWIDTPNFRDEAESYSKFVLLLMRLPAWQQIAFKPWTKQFKLFCNYQGERYRVTGASRLGDIWLTKDFFQETGYQLRVDIVNCSDWSNGDEG